MKVCQFCSRARRSVCGCPRCFAYRRHRRRDRACGVAHGLDDRRVLAHSEIVVRAPDDDFTSTVLGRGTRIADNFHHAVPDWRRCDSDLHHVGQLGPCENVRRTCSRWRPHNREVVDVIASATEASILIFVNKCPTSIDDTAVGRDQRSTTNYTRIVPPDGVGAQQATNCLGRLVRRRGFNCAYVWLTNMPGKWPIPCDPEFCSKGFHSRT